MKSRLSLAVVFAVLMGIAACSRGGQEQAPGAAGGGAGTEAPATSTATVPGAAQGTTGQAGY
jgi:hypothetical protein